jgi:glycosyltransferase involved in cell wall biosynthesis
MRILFVARRYWPAVGGVESFLRHIAREIGSRHELTVLASRIDDGPHTRLSDSLHPPLPFQPFRDGSVSVKPLHLPARRRARMLPLYAHVTPGLRRYAYGRSRIAAASLVASALAPVIVAEARGVDVIHMWAGDMLASATVRAGQIAGVPVVITPFAHEGQWGHDCASIRAYKQAARVLALLTSEADFYGRLGVAPEKIAVTGVCAPQVEIIPQDAARQRLGVAGPLVLFLGARRPYKGFDLLLKAAPEVARHFPETTFAFVGPGARLEDVPNEVKVLDVGSVDESEKALWLNAADIACLPSAAEILPVSILEAWSTGTPVLTSEIPALVELIGASGGGVCCAREAASIAIALVGLLSDRESLREMGGRGRRSWEDRYSPQVVAQEHETAYATVHGPFAADDPAESHLVRAPVPIRRPS